VYTLDSALLTLKNGDFQARWDIAKEIPTLGELAVPRLLALLDEVETDEELSWFIVKILGSFHHPDAVLALVEQLDPSQPEDRSAIAAQMLAEIGVEVLDSIAPLLEDPIRQPLAVRAIAQVEHPSAVPLLLKTWPQVQTPQLRELILEALDKFQDPAIVPVFLQGIQDENPAVRRVAIAGLSSRTSAYSKDHLVDKIILCLADPALEVADQSARTLGRLATDAAAIALVDKCCDLDTPPVLQQTFIQSLGWIGSSRALDGLMQVWQTLGQSSAPPEPLLKEVLASLSRATVDRSEAAQKIVLLLRSPTLQASISLKLMAAFSLGRLAQEETLDDLIELLAEPDYALRLHAIAALKQVSPDRAYQEIQRRSKDSSTPPTLAEGLAIALQEW
jgi:HEAT repeat protein